MRMGTGADRQLRVFRETGDLKKVVDYIIEETEVGLGERWRRRTGPSDDEDCERSHRQLNQLPFDPELAPGARNAVQRVPARAAARESHGDHRRGALEIAAALVHELEARRLPLPRLRARRRGAASADGHAAGRSLDDMETSQVSIFAVQAQQNELKSRMQMTDVVNRRKIRHAHMVNINRQIMLEGMRADFHESGSAQREGLEIVRERRADSRHDAGRHGL